MFGMSHCIPQMYKTQNHRLWVTNYASVQVNQTCFDSIMFCWFSICGNQVFAPKLYVEYVSIDSVSESSKAFIAFRKHYELLYPGFLMNDHFFIL